MPSRERTGACDVLSTAAQGKAIGGGMIRMRGGGGMVWHGQPAAAAPEEVATRVRQEWKAVVLLSEVVDGGGRRKGWSRGCGMTFSQFQPLQGMRALCGRSPCLPRRRWVVGRGQGGHLRAEPTSATAQGEMLHAHKTSALAPLRPCRTLPSSPYLFSSSSCVATGYTYYSGLTIMRSTYTQHEYVQHIQLGSSCTIAHADWKNIPKWWSHLYQNRN